MKEFGLNDAELFPLLTPESGALLRRLREHPHAPRYNWKTGERLTADALARVNSYAQHARANPPRWSHAQPPPWVAQFIREARRSVPFYRERENWPRDDHFSSLPLTTRDDIRRWPGAFVPDSISPGDLIVYTTSGTTGSCLTYPALPELPSRYLPLFQLALDAHAVRLEGGNRVSIVQVCFQSPTVVLCSVSSYLSGAGFVKVNLHPSDWNHPDDAARFLNDCAPELYTGDPFALSQLMQLPLHTQPKAIISSAGSLSGGLSRELSLHFHCPVLDLYSMNEAGPIAYSTSANTHDLLQPDLYVEILDEHAHSCEPGVVGQIVLTGGANPCLPLIRYLTGDYAAMDYPAAAPPRLVNLHGRKPIVFRDTAGRSFNSIDVASALRHLLLAGVMLHQGADHSLRLHARTDAASLAEAIDILRTLFGSDQRIDTHPWPDLHGSAKPITFSSDLPASTS